MKYIKAKLRYLLINISVYILGHLCEQDKGPTWSVKLGRLPRRSETWNKSPLRQKAIAAWVLEEQKQTTEKFHFKH